MDSSTKIALLSGGFALAGVALSQVLAFFQEGSKRKHDRNILLRQKYEEMGQLLISSMQRSGDLMHAKNPIDMQSLSHDEGANKCHLLCQLYFPDLVPFSSLYLETNMGLFYSLIESYNPNDPRSFGAQAVGKPTYEEAKTGHFEARDKFIDAIQANAQTYAKA